MVIFTLYKYNTSITNKVNNNVLLRMMHDEMFTMVYELKTLMIYV